MATEGKYFTTVGTVPDTLEPIGTIPSTAFRLLQQRQRLVSLGKIHHYSALYLPGTICRSSVAVERISASGRPAKLEADVPFSWIDSEPAPEYRWMLSTRSCLVDSASY